MPFGSSVGSHVEDGKTLRTRVRTSRQELSTGDIHLTIS